MDYHPRPIDTSGVRLGPELMALTERLAENNHDLWAAKRLAEGWRYGPHRDDTKKEHPGLVPYAELSESEKDYDRLMALEVLAVIVQLGYRLQGPPA